MDQEIVYLSDSEDVTEQGKGSNTSGCVELDPELLSYIGHLPSIKVEDNEIQEIVDRYINIECNTHMKREVSNDIYADPIPSCSHQNVQILKVSNDIYDNPAPGCSHHYMGAQNILAEREIKHEPDLNIEMCSCSNIVCNTTVLEPKSSLDVEQVPKPIGVEGNRNNLETLTLIDTSESIQSDKSILQNNENTDNSLRNTIPENEIEPSIYEEPVESLTLLYHQINGLRNIRIDLNEEGYIEFCAKVVNMKSNHSLLISEIEKGNLIKFEQLVIWGRNLKRKVEDLIKEAKPHGCIVDEAQKFVFKMMHTEIKYRQRLAVSNETYIFDDTNHYKFHCMACDRRDDNLTWLVAHLCRDTAEMIYMCCFCGFLFFNNACSLIYHVIFDLLEEPKKEYCVECEEFFPSVANHLMDIEGSWKVRCNICDFISLSRCSFLIHQRYHKMEKHHVCPECGAYFVFFKALEDHITDVCYFNAKKIRHICPICAVIFKDQQSLCRHLFSIHHQRWIKCIQCHMLLISRMQYISHRAQNHPESPCTYQICHTCTLCPGREFKSSAAQFHMKDHANDVINVIILYICDCNYYTIHKYNFIEHKAQNCEATSTFGKWDNDHEMKICGSCNDAKFVNLSKPFVCESCEVLNNPEQGISSLTYECKVCKYFLIYNWEAVIEHFFCSHPNIPVHKFPSCVKSTYISGSNGDWISRCSDEINSSHNLSNNEMPCFSSLPHNPCVGFGENPQKMFLKIHRINNTSINVINHNVSKAQPFGKKQTTKKKCKTDNIPIYNINSLSHFMALNSEAPSNNHIKKQFKKNNSVLNLNNIPSLPSSINDVSVRRLEQSVSILDSTLPEGGNTMLEANNLYARQDRIAVDIKQEINTMQCVSTSEVEKNELKSSSVNVFCGKNSIIEETISPNQSGVKCADHTVYSLVKTHESSGKTAFEDNVIYVKKSFDPNLFDKANNLLEQHLSSISSEDSVKTNVDINVIKKKTLECKKCQYKCNEAIDLVKHFIDAHYIQNTYQCMECGDCFTNLKKKINHLRSTHKIDTKSYLEPDFNRLDTCRSKFRCPVCLRGFLNDHDKNLHMRCHGMAYLQSIRSNTKEM
ncbi:uncharacterized protein [Halyomorpha halys]|uniref:uncharacterized protein isoform X2 n=1 Tax=Halyomorpha halys TaxID=286706 RepID=UPI0006D50FC5|nr:uncharacterized protein LOC106688892 isoform X2 [Halyomorpha halys]